MGRRFIANMECDECGAVWQQDITELVENDLLKRYHLSRNCPDCGNPVDITEKSMCNAVESTMEFEFSQQYCIVLRYPDSVGVAENLICNDYLEGISKVMPTLVDLFKEDVIQNWLEKCFNDEGVAYFEGVTDIYPYELYIFLLPTNIR